MVKVVPGLLRGEQNEDENSGRRVSAGFRMATICLPSLYMRLAAQLRRFRHDVGARHSLLLQGSIHPSPHAHSRASWVYTSHQPTIPAMEPEESSSGGAPATSTSWRDMASQVFVTDPKVNGNCFADKPVKMKAPEV